MENIDIDIDIDKEILENIDIDIEKEISENIDIDKISNRLEFGISNRSIQNSLFLGAKTFEGIVPQREHVHDGEVPQECHHLQGERDVSDQSSG